MPKQQGFQDLNTDTQSDRESLREGVRESFDELRESSKEEDFSSIPRSSSELAAHCGCTKEAIQDRFKVVAQAYFWLPLSELKSGVGKNTRYSPFFIKQMCNLQEAREAGQIASEWVTAIHGQNSHAIAEFKKSQILQQQQPEVAVIPPQITGGLMNLPNLAPVESFIIPQGITLFTDNNPAKDLAIRSDALSQGLEGIERLKNFLKGASAVADSYIENLEKTTEEEERQAKEVEDLAFELEVKAGYIKRAEIRKEVIKKDASKTKIAAESKVADFASFFAKRSQQNASS